MRLTRLVAHGFKSFRDRTVIHFDQGITGIVGPNGCGKSNIVDALFWVMGEMSAKHLRGDTMKDVIFAGSSKYSPASWAEVTLVLENDEGKHIHIGNKISNPSEIQLTRKLYRNSETEYRINGIPCRLKDIQEIFMDTGAGAKSYSIIAQGEIEKLVQAKPQERRTMIEEVAGITKFKVRRRESLRKIDQTKLNLARLSDLQQELEKNLSNLSDQANKAERAIKLKETIKENELRVESNKVYKILKDRRLNASDLAEKKAELESNKTRKNNLEVSLESERNVKEELQSTLDDFQKIFNELARALAASEAKVEFLEESKEDKSNQILRFTEENDSTHQELEEVKTRCEELILERKELEEKNEEEVDLTDLSEKVEFLKAQLEEKQELVGEKSKKYDELLKEVQGLDQEVYKNINRQDEMASRLQDVTAEIEALEKQYSGVSTDISEEREKVNEAEGLVEKLSNSYIELKNKLDDLQKIESELKTKKDEALKQMIVVESKFNSLLEINESLEGVKEGTQEFLKEQRGDEYTLFGNNIQCEEQYAQAVQRVLFDYLESMITVSDDIDEILNWHGNNKKAYDLIFPIAIEENWTEETIERLKFQLSSSCNWQEEDKGIISLDTVVSFSDEKFDKYKEIFKGHFIVQNLSEKSAQIISKDARFKSLVSFDGSIFIKNSESLRSLSVGSADDLSQGIIARNNTIKELKKELSKVKIDSETIENDYQEIVTKIDENSTSYEELREEFSDAKADFAVKKSSLESKVSGFEIGSSRLEILGNRKNEISKQRLDMMEQKEVLDKQLNIKKDKLSEVEAFVADGKESLVNIQSSYSDSKEELVKMQIEASSLEDRLKTAASRVSDFERQLEKGQLKLENNMERVEELQEEVVRLNDEYDEVSEGNKDKSEELKKRDEEMSTHREELVKLLQGMQDRENEVRGLGKEINLADRKVIELENKLERYIGDEEQVSRNIFEKYQIDLRNIIGSFLDYNESEYFGLADLTSMYEIAIEDGVKKLEKEGYEFEVLQTKELEKVDGRFKRARNEFNQLGDINWQAIEDYRRQKLRCTFLKEQEQELKLSLEDLEKAIEHIDNKSRERFKVAFNEVSERFQKVFPIIFGGGSAHLKIVGDLNDPECGVDIIAQPPGKKMQNINLMSGGEKALTAVSLIFSIFLVKPSPFCLLDEVDAPLDDANVGRFNELLREMSKDSQFILITHNKKTMEMNDTLYGITMEEPGISKAVSVQLQ